MKLIKELKDLEVVGFLIPKSEEEYKIRIAARAIILDENGNIAILSTPKSKHYHQIKEIGEIIEYKNAYNQKQTSYCLLARINSKKGKPKLTKEEKDAGYQVEWMPINEAIKLFQDIAPEDYTAKFIQLRDYNFLLETKKKLE